MFHVQKINLLGDIKLLDYTDFLNFNLRLQPSFPRLELTLALQKLFYRKCVIKLL